MSVPTQHVHKWVAKALPHEPSLKVCECGATMTDREYRDVPVAASGRERVHPRPKFLRRFALAIGLVWIAASLVVSVLVHDHAPAWIVAGFPAPLWATLGAAYATDHHWRRDAS